MKIYKKEKSKGFCDMIAPPHHTPHHTTQPPTANPS